MSSVKVISEQKALFSDRSECNVSSGLSYFHNNLMTFHLYIHVVQGRPPPAQFTAAQTRTLIWIIAYFLVFPRCSGCST